MATAATAVATPLPAPLAVKKALLKSQSLVRMTKMVAKTNPKDMERQQEEREVFVKRAMLSHLSYGVDPSFGQASSDTVGGVPAANGDKTAGPSEGQLLRKIYMFIQINDRLVNFLINY